ncbi:hypothetical protein CJ179_48115 [Rhodococcus sp. ACS1]|uniref:hypothetical protein n=1 Tax=Rhodococcus sp. ACS1 TaxID=2028570 RepID=UPI000BCD59E9|nr:hypothetical protein [Rhodococcus sp. ACS1]PBC35374.1 hypothetical protein CJ179_48115 [Rhodococcus sp. ACS1]
MPMDPRSLDSAALTIAESNDVLTAPGAFYEVVKVLDEVHHLKFVGAGSARLQRHRSGIGRCTVAWRGNPRGC